MLHISSDETGTLVIINLIDKPKLKIHTIDPNIGISGNVAAIYDEAWYVGNIVECEEEKDVFVNFKGYIQKFKILPVSKKKR